MEFNVSDLISIGNEIYDIKGKVRYINKSDNCYWYEYRIISKKTNVEKWLSIDDTYKEYSISVVAKNKSNVSTDYYHLVDEGTLEAVNVWGLIDVDLGETAYFYEYEDSSEENIISIEKWSDGEEISEGYYLEPNQIRKLGTYGDTTNSNVYRNNHNPVSSVIKAILVLGILGTIGIFIFSMFSSSTIADYLKDNSSYSYVTSITGSNKQNADVYKSSLSLDGTAKDIIDGIDGNTESVQQNTEDGDTSIAILTDDEYCLVYTSEDKQVLVQISEREYTYSSNSTPYHASRFTNRYYRRYYYSRAFTKDKSTFGGTSSYSSFNDSTVKSNASDTYNSYSSSVRQSSTTSRSTSGGGISSGK